VTAHLPTTYRTHTAGELTRADVGSDVTLCGWVQAVRTQGGVAFVDVRDRYGRTQVTFRGEADAALLGQAERLRPEWVVRVSGRVIERPAAARNANLATGDVEIDARVLEVLSEAQVPPFQPDERTEAGVEVRWKHRYIDLRRPRLSRALAERARITSAFRRHLEEQGFLEVETPILYRSTPEGARDYIVPSRLHPGSWYALPQSPQLFKQLLMVGGQDRYYQIARCFRDEDSRADRQPEFTQVDIEASFVAEPDVQALLEPVVAALVKAYRGHEVRAPFPRMTYQEAMSRFGSDKPDLRNPLELVDVSEAARALGFAPFTQALAAGGRVRALVGPQGAQLSRKEIEALEAEAKALGAPGLGWVKAGPAPAGALAKVLAGPAGQTFLAAARAGEGDLVLVAAGSSALTSRVLGTLRTRLAERLGLVDRTRTALLWVTDFPLLEWDAEESRYVALHHPFTSPRPEDVPAILEAAARGAAGADRSLVSAVCARAYDLVLDGIELGGGSIRIHQSAVQQAMFALLGLDETTIQRRFGWFVDALKYGTPPHGGIALGLDRFVMLLLGETTISEVIAFPKTAQAADLLTGAPSPVDDRQLKASSIDSIRYLT
jgi:aspartyl-tRNA synthetase